jgi:hypothetical protein
MEFDNSLNGVIGNVKVIKNGNIFEGEFTVPEMKKELLKYLSPAISGYVIESEVVDGIRTIKACKLSAVSLTAGNNCDPRIGKLENVEIED